MVRQYEISHAQPGKQTATFDSARRNGNMFKFLHWKAVDQDVKPKTLYVQTKVN